MNARLVVLHLLKIVDGDPMALDHLMTHDVNMARLDHRDRSFVFETVYGILRNRLRLDHYITHFLQDKKPTRNKDLMRILRLGAYQALYMDKVPHHAIVNEAVNQAKESIKTRHLAGLANALLRNIIAKHREVKLPDASDLVARLTIEFSHPEWLVKRWLDRLGLAKTKRLLAFNNERPDIFLRRKVRGISKQQFETDAKAICTPLTPTGFMNLYYKLDKSMTADGIALLREGWCAIQAPSSGWVVALLEPQPNDRILDLCSAPGGKTALMAELATSGTVVACDNRARRLADVAETKQRLKLSNVRLCAVNGAVPAFKGGFDRVLVDAPCSATGVLNHHPEARWTKSTDDIARLSELQSRIIRAASLQVRPGGVLVYATCSLEAEENELLVQAFLKEARQFALEKPPASIPTKFVDLDGYLRILPHEHGMDGMFAARLRRT